MHVLGIDPGSRVTGIGLVALRKEGLTALYYAALELGNGPLPERIGWLCAGINEVLTTYAVDCAAVEAVFARKNLNAALKLGQARGAALATLVGNGLPIGEYTPGQIKDAVVGRGRAQKGQVGYMVRALLGLSDRVTEDAADALACAVCHLHHQQARGRRGLQGGSGR